MNAVDKAIWYIENHTGEDITLDVLASVVGVSRYHLSRIFCYSVGQPMSRYLRLRRLSKAAQALAAGAPDILDLALSLGYGSHEAFSRAFKQHFGTTPEQVRLIGHTRNLQLMEAMTLEQITGSERTALAQPRRETLGELRLVGISRHYPFSSVGDIPAQWQDFVPYIPRLTAEVSPVTYGVIYNGGDERFDYLSGLEGSLTVASGSNLGQDALPGDGAGALTQLTLAAQNYLVFSHPGHVAQVRATCDGIWSRSLPESGEQAVEAPWFERYGTTFDPQTGHGGLEIWIPVADRGV